VTAPASITLIAANAPSPHAAAAPYMFVSDAWLSALQVDDEIDVIDARGAKRHLRITQCAAQTCSAETTQTIYLTPDSELKRRRKGAARSTRPLSLPCFASALHLHRGDVLTLTAERDTTEFPATVSTARAGSAEIGCTLPEVFSQVRVGERIWFDDGRIGGVIRQTADNGMTVEITQAREGGEKLLGDKGINLPDSDLKLPALTAKDVEDLSTVAKLADLVALSFVQQATDIDTLRELLREHNAEDIGIVLKIETRRGFENLPELLFSAMKSKSAGVMIARGDLAVECGYERLAEVQEEILWAAEAAHLPVIWATQVLETLAKTGLPSRAEITDAAMGERAECVMLNKGPHIIDAMRTLDDILRRMQSHQSKKRPLLRALRAWTLAPKSAA
jgi:pyruvate kinase